MGEDHTHVAADEFRKLAVQCAHCKNYATFDAEDEYSPSPDARCPNCNMPMAGLPRLIVAFRAFYAELKQQRRPGYFVVKRTT